MRMHQGMKRMREHQLPSGDQLVVAPSMDDANDSLLEISRRTALAPQRFAPTYLSTTPLPLYGIPDEPTPRRAGSNAIELRSPVFWIPDDIAMRYPILDDTAPKGIQDETVDEGAVRIVTHMLLARLYDIETGYFLDVPMALGHDLTDPAVAERFQNWLEGKADPELDTLDPSPLWHADSMQADTRGTGLDPTAIAAYDANLAQLVAVPMDDLALTRAIDETDANIDVCHTRGEVTGFALTGLAHTLQEQLDTLRPAAQEALHAGLEALDTAETA
jgi:hypothetical protein